MSMSDGDVRRALEILRNEQASLEARLKAAIWLLERHLGPVL